MCVCVSVRVSERQRELQRSKGRQQHCLSQYRLGSATARARSLAPAGDIIWCHLALQSCCSSEETQEGAVSWKGQKVTKTQKAEEAEGRKGGLLEEGPRQKTRECVTR